MLGALSRGGMVYSHKLSMEFLIYKRELLLNKELNAQKQKEQSEQTILLKQQNPAGQRT